MADRFQKTALSIGLLLLVLAVAAIAHYYAIALPRHNAAKLRFEKEKYEEEKSQRERLESESEYRS